MVQYSLLDEYENGVKAVRSRSGNYVVTEDGEEIPFASPYRSNDKPVRLFAALRVQYGDFPILDGPDILPSKIAIAGKPAIASYLYAVHPDHFGGRQRRHRREVGDFIGVSRSTVLKYHRRVLREVKDSRVGGSGR